MTESVIVYNTPLEKYLWESIVNNPNYVFLVIAFFAILYLNVYCFGKYLWQLARKIERYLKIKSDKAIYIVFLISAIEAVLLTMMIF